MSGTLKKSQHSLKGRKWKDTKAALYEKKFYLWSEGSKKPHTELDLTKCDIEKVAGSATPKFKLIAKSHKKSHSHEFQVASQAELVHWVETLQRNK